MRIAYFVEGMPTSGIETSTQLLARTLRRRGHRVTFFVPWPTDRMKEGRMKEGRMKEGRMKEGSDEECGDDIYRLPSLCVNSKQEVYWSYPLSIKLIAKFLRDPYDLIHIHTSSSINLLVWQLSRALDLPLIYTYHTMSREYAHYFGSLAQTMAPLMDSAIKAFDRATCNAADLVIAPSRKAADYLDEIGITPLVKTIPNGIDLTQFERAPSDYLTTRLGIDPARKVLLFVGRLNHEKRPLEAYQVFHELSRRMADVDLAMAGEGPLGETLREQAQRDGLAARLHLLGRVPHGEMPALYNAADLWFSTSTSEVHPMVALEAAACGLPAVAIQDRALEGVVIHNTTGLIANNEAEMVSELVLLLNDPALRARMSAATLEHVRRFDIEEIGNRYVELYSNIIARV